MTKEQIDQMVNAFLCWKIPQTFNPDCYISFAPKSDFRGNPPTWPVGTNLFSYTEAKAMVEHMVAALSPAPTVPEGWRDIASAPKNNTSRLVWCPLDRCIYCVAWVDNSEYPPAKSGWQVFGGGEIIDGVTHWMPLPAPPAAPEAGR